MKRSVVFVVFFLILGFALAGLYWSQRRPKPSPVSANAILNMAADAQRDLSRGPMHFTRLSDEREIAIGRELATRYATQTRKLTPDEEGLEKYVTRVGGAVAVHAHRHLPYTFTVLPDHNMINAFSLPGGSVYIGEGMLDLMVTEDELANILAHEIEHIDHYHCVERVQVEAKLKDLNLDQLTTALRSDRDAAEQLSTWSQTFTVSNLIDTTRPDAARSAVKCGAVIVALLKLFFANHGQGLRASSPTNAVAGSDNQPGAGSSASTPPVH